MSGISGHDVIVGIVYRPPNHNLELFVEKFNQILFNISKSNEDILLDIERLQHRYVLLE